MGESCKKTCTDNKFTCDNGNIDKSGLAGYAPTINQLLGPAVSVSLHLFCSFGPPDIEPTPEEQSSPVRPARSHTFKRGAGAVAGAGADAALYVLCAEKSLRQRQLRVWSPLDRRISVIRSVQSWPIWTTFEQDPQYVHCTYPAVCRREECTVRMKRTVAGKTARSTPANAPIQCSPATTSLMRSASVPRPAAPPAVATPSSLENAVCATASSDGCLNRRRTHGHRGRFFLDVVRFRFNSLLVA